MGIEKLCSRFEALKKQRTAAATRDRDFQEQAEDINKKKPLALANGDDVSALSGEFEAAVQGKARARNEVSELDVALSIIRDRALSEVVVERAARRERAISESEKTLDKFRSGFEALMPILDKCADAATPVCVSMTGFSFDAISKPLDTLSPMAAGLFRDAVGQRFAKIVETGKWPHIDEFNGIEEKLILPVEAERKDAADADTRHADAERRFPGLQFNLHQFDGQGPEERRECQADFEQAQKAVDDCREIIREKDLDTFTKEN